MLVKLESIVTRPRDDEKVYLFLTEDEDVVMVRTSVDHDVEVGAKCEIELPEVGTSFEDMPNGCALIKTTAFVVLPTATPE